MYPDASRASDCGSLQAEEPVERLLLPAPWPCSRRRALTRTEPALPEIGSHLDRLESNTAIAEWLRKHQAVAPPKFWEPVLSTISKPPMHHRMAPQTPGHSGGGPVEASCRPAGQRHGCRKGDMCDRSDHGSGRRSTSGSRYDSRFIQKSTTLVAVPPWKNQNMPTGRAVGFWCRAIAAAPRFRCRFGVVRCVGRRRRSGRLRTSPHAIDAELPICCGYAPSCPRKAWTPGRRRGQ